MLAIGILFFPPNEYRKMRKILPIKIFIRERVPPQRCKVVGKPYPLLSGFEPTIMTNY